MIRASRAIQRVARADSGAILPEIPELETLYRSKFKVKFRHGQVVMIAGAPGEGKSAFTLWMAERWGLPGIYFSADMEESTAMERLAALVSGDSTDMVAAAVRKGGAVAYAEEVDRSQVHFCFDPNPSLTTIWEEIEAYVEMYDQYPSWIVVDNLMDCVIEGENEFSAMKQMILELKDVARQTGACVVMLHHMSESDMTKSGTTPGFPAARRWVMGKVNQTAAMILSVALDPDGTFRVAVVKHRNGPSDKSAQEFLEFRSDMERNRFYPRSMQRAAEIARGA